MLYSGLNKEEPEVDTSEHLETPSCEERPAEEQDKHDSMRMHISFKKPDNHLFQANKLINLLRP